MAELFALIQNNLVLVVCFLIITLCFVVCLLLASNTRAGNFLASFMPAFRTGKPWTTRQWIGAVVIAVFIVVILLL